uniref:EF-hand domain-containing protein n=1 Tax=Setaria digitata TaxID=48799 RepID=A0A915PHG5_9BILA
MSTPPAHRTTVSELERSFRSYDNDGDGAITLEQAMEILKETVKLTDREMIEAKFQSTDTNHDGRISFEEFMNMIKES